MSIYGAESKSVQVRPATPEDHEAAAEALALAFVDDPAWAHLLPDSETRGERLLTFFSAEIENVVPRYRELWVTEDGSGAAIWGRPGEWRVPFARTARAPQGMIKGFGRGPGAAPPSQLRVGGAPPRPPKHWDLPFHGGEPRGPRRGPGA